MLSWLRNKLRQPSGLVPEHTRPAVPALSSMNLHQLPLLSASELIQILDAANLLRSIRRLVAVQEAHWEALYQPALNRFLETCQLAPASMAHHHAGPGGLAAHSLESLEIALLCRKPLVLPRNADPDTSARQEHIWTYALFVAVLMHDVGKLHTSIRLRLSSNQCWNPYLILNQHRTETYRVEFATTPYKLHQRIANSGLHLLPKAGMAWLNQYPQILAHVCAYLYGDIFEAGVIGELAQKSDGESVARNLKNHGDRIRFPGAPTIPLVDRLMIGLRQMLEARDLKINGHGADGWSDGRHIWLVCGTVARKLIDFLRQDGVTQIPTDNNRIFDTLQEHGYILPTDQGKAIWHTIVTGPEGTYRFELTMLKFEIERLIPATRRPAAFDGNIDVITRSGQPLERQLSNSSNTEPPVIPSPAADPAPDSVSRSSATTAASRPTPATDYRHSMTPETGPAELDCLPEWMQEELVDAASTDPYAQREPSTPETGTAPQKTGEAAPESTNEDAMGLVFDDILPKHLDDNTGQLFVDWLARMLRHGKITINRSDAIVHIVPEGALVVSPRAFKEFVTFYDLFKNGNDVRLSTNEAARHVQKKVEKLRQNIKNPTGMSIHHYLITGKNRVSRVSGFLFDPLKLFGHVTAPTINPLLTNKTRK